MKKILILIITCIITLVCSVVYAESLLFFDNIPSSLYTYKYLSLAFGLVVFCIGTPFISWYFKYRKNEQERLIKIYEILYNMCSILEKIDMKSDTFGEEIRYNTKQLQATLQELVPNHERLMRDIEAIGGVKNNTDMLNKMIGRDDEPKSLKKYRKCD